VLIVKTAQSNRLKQKKAPLSCKEIDTRVRTATSGKHSIVLCMPTRHLNPHSHTHTRNSDTNTDIHTFPPHNTQPHTHYIHTQSLTRRTHTDAHHNHTLITSTLLCTLTSAKTLCSH
jgi:hypothetical protein